MQGSAALARVLHRKHLKTFIRERHGRANSSLKSAFRKLIMGSNKDGWVRFCSRRRRIPNAIKVMGQAGQERITPALRAEARDRIEMDRTRDAAVELDTQRAACWDENNDMSHSLE